MIKKRNTGFTLIELAMVLFILGLLLSSFLAPLAARVEQEERKNTQIQLNEIEEVIYGYVLQNNHFPCPDCSNNTGGCAAATANDGAEDTVDGPGDSLICASEVGNLPWATLGVKSADEWDNGFTYRVDSDFSDRNDLSITPNDQTADGTGCETASSTLNVSFSLCSDGDIDVWNMEDTTDPDYESVAADIPAIVVSHGKNWRDGSPSNDEAENTDGDDNFVDKDYSQTSGSEFDDMLIWISPYILRTMAVKSGILP